MACCAAGCAVAVRQLFLRTGLYATVQPSASRTCDQPWPLHTQCASMLWSIPSPCASSLRLSLMACQWNVSQSLVAMPEKAWSCLGNSCTTAGQEACRVGSLTNTCIEQQLLIWYAGHVCIVVVWRSMSALDDKHLLLGHAFVCGVTPQG